MIRVICRLAAKLARLSFVAAAPPGGALLCFSRPCPAWAGEWLERLLRAAGHLKRGEEQVDSASLGTSGRAKVARTGVLRAEFAPGSFDVFRAAVMREAADFTALTARLPSRAS